MQKTLVIRRVEGTLLRWRLIRITMPLAASELADRLVEFSNGSSRSRRQTIHIHDLQLS